MYKRRLYVAWAFLESPPFYSYQPVGEVYAGRDLSCLNSLGPGLKGDWPMALGRQKDRQGDLMVSWSEMPRSPDHVFCGRLRSVLFEGDIDGFVEGIDSVRGQVGRLDLASIAPIDARAICAFLRGRYWLIVIAIPSKPWLGRCAKKMDRPKDVVPGGAGFSERTLALPASVGPTARRPHAFV